MEPTTTSATERAHTAIRQAIIRGTYAPGTLLGETELAAGIGVSRTPVRAALARLQEEGWLTVYPKRGVMVRGLTPRETRDLTDARLTLEAAGATRAGPARRAQTATALASSVADQRAALAGGRVDEFIELTTSFHRAFVEMGDNQFLVGVAHHLADRQQQLLFTETDRLLDRADAIIAEHEHLLELLRDADPADFVAALREHLSRTHDLELSPVPPL